MAKKSAVARPVVRRNGATPSRREEILAVAAELFAGRGYRATTVRDIADAAGLLSGSLYHHFDSKETMVDELLGSFLTDLLQRCRAVAAEGLTPRQTLVRLVEESFDALPRHSAAIVVFQHDADHLAQLERFRYLTAVGDELQDLWVGVLRAGAEAGELVVEDAELTYRFIRDAVWMAVHWYRLDGPLTTRDLSRQYLRMLLGGLAVN